MIFLLLLSVRLLLLLNPLLAPFLLRFPVLLLHAHVLLGHLLLLTPRDHPPGHSHLLHLHLLEGYGQVDILFPSCTFRNLERTHHH